MKRRKSERQMLTLGNTHLEVKTDTTREKQPKSCAQPSLLSSESRRALRLTIITVVTLFSAFRYSHTSITGSKGRLLTRNNCAVGHSHALLRTIPNEANFRFIHES